MVDIVVIGGTQSKSSPQTHAASGHALKKQFFVGVDVLLYVYRPKSPVALFG